METADRVESHSFGLARIHGFADGTAESIGGLRLDVDAALRTRMNLYSPASGLQPSCHPADDFVFCHD